jgi:hypothetical protein
MRRVQKAQ